MKAEQNLYWLHALSPLHVGSGRGEGYIDLPLQREQTSKYPIVPGSAIKGVLADHYGATEERRLPKSENGDLSEASKRKPTDLGLVFGTGGERDSRAGAMALTDARLACFPIASVYGTFAWCSSPMVLRRLARDLESVQADKLAVPDVDNETIALVTTPVNTRKCALANTTNKIYLEDLDFTASEDETTAQWAEWIADRLFAADQSLWREEFRVRFTVLHDNVFQFISQTATEIQAHIRIDDEHKRVADGALWYEECLPAETILAGLVWWDRFGPLKDETERSRLMGEYCPPGETLNLQIGGNATVGKGRVRCVFSAASNPGGH